MRAVPESPDAGGPGRQQRPAGRPASAAATPVERLDQALFVLFLLALAFVPFLFGSNYLLGWGLNAVIFGTLVLAFELGGLVLGRPYPVAPRRVAMVLGLFVLVVLWICLQISSMTPEAWHNPFWRLGADVLAPRLPAFVPEGSISVTPDEGVIALVRLGTTAAAFWLGLQLCRGRGRGTQFLYAMVAIAFFYAMFGVIQFMVAPGSVLWASKVQYQGAVTSTFVNRNAYASYAGIGMLLAVGLLIEEYRWRAPLREGARRYVAAMIEATWRRGLLLIGVIGAIAVALFWTGSRAGIVSTIAGLALLLALAPAFARHKHLLLAVVPFVILAIVFVLVGYGEDFSQRLQVHGDLDPRLSIAGTTFRAAMDAPWTGFGYGSLERMFAVYRDATSLSELHWDKAHNTYVELLFELGVPATIALSAIVVAVLYRIVANLSRRHSPSMLSLVALAASAIVLLHALVDFSLQIQAIAITYWALLGAGLAQSWSRRVDVSAAMPAEGRRTTGYGAVARA